MLVSETVATTANAVKTILISQPKPHGKHPYEFLEKKYGTKIDFRQFIEVKGITSKEFRKLRINPLDYSAIIFTSRNAISHFFRICEENRIKMLSDTKYFCASEAIALYLQKFIEYRKRKVFFGKDRSVRLMDVIKKHKKNEKFLLPCSASSSGAVSRSLTAGGYEFTEAPIYETVSSDLSDLENIFYDMIVFFSPLGVKSLYENFPNFKQNKTRLAAYGPATTKAIEEAGLNLNVKAPAPGISSISMAIEKYMKAIEPEIKK